MACFPYQRMRAAYKAPRGRPALMFAPRLLPLVPHQGHGKLILDLFCAADDVVFLHLVCRSRFWTGRVLSNIVVSRRLCRFGHPGEVWIAKACVARVGTDTEIVGLSRDDEVLQHPPYIPDSAAQVLGCIPAALQVISLYNWHIQNDMCHPIDLLLFTPPSLT